MIIECSLGTRLDKWFADKEQERAPRLGREEPMPTALSWTPCHNNNQQKQQPLMSERCSHFLFRSSSDCRLSLPLAPWWMALINQFPLGKCAAVVRITEWVGRGNQGRRDHHPLRAHHNSSRSDQINTAGQARCNTHVIRDCYRDDLAFTTVILLLLLLLFLLKMWPQEFLPSLLLRRIPEGTFMTPCASLSLSLPFSRQPVSSKGEPANLRAGKQPAT